MSTVVQWPRPVVVDTDPNRITSQQVCATADITYRQLDFWTRTYLIPGTKQQLEPGSGAARSFTPRQLAFVVALGRLVRAGIPPQIGASALVKQTVDGHLPTRLDMGGGVEVVLHDLNDDLAATS